MDAREARDAAIECMARLDASVATVKESCGTGDFFCFETLCMCGRSRRESHHLGDRSFGMKPGHTW